MRKIDYEVEGQMDIFDFITDPTKETESNTSIAIIDADLIGRSRHRFPNLVCMKISGYYKELGYDVELKMDYKGLEQYHKVFISKVFTDTPIDNSILNLPNVEYGGTGFFFDKAPNLPDEIEHHMPDYHLYDEFVQSKIDDGDNSKQYDEYTDYSIGFLTRGCFRKCGFCVNQKYSHVFQHSPLQEFYDPERKKICLLDDNFLGCPNWKQMLQELIDTGKPFKFKQGLDERILTDEKCEMLFHSRYDGHITFAFDNIDDYELIHKKLKMIRKHSSHQCSFYVLCGFDKFGNYDDSFWEKDISDVFKRIELLGMYGMTPYIMRFEKYKESKYAGIYISLARWINQVSFFKKESFEEYVTTTDWKSNGCKDDYSSKRALNLLKQDMPQVYKQYANKKFFNKCKKEGD